MTIKDRSEMPDRRIEIDLTGPQGNVFYLMGRVKGLGRQLGWIKDEIDIVIEDMSSGDYDHAVEVFDEYFGEYVTLYR